MRNLGIFLNKLESQYHRAQYLYSDPVEFVHRYQDPFDQEAVALLAAMLAYGNVRQIRKSVEEALRRMEHTSRSPYPREFIKRLQDHQFKKSAQIAFKDYVHRFNNGADLISLFSLLNRSWKTYGSMGAHFTKYLSHSAETIENALILFLRDWSSWIDPTSNSPGLRFLLSSPEKGSCCKRWCMFLRWMGRKDSIDLGLWNSKGLLPSQLVMPLDTHTGRISQYLGLTSKKNLNWKAALEVTNSLKEIDPTDPTRYDFAICRLGILDLCQKKYRKEVCSKCQLSPVCQIKSLSR